TEGDPGQVTVIQLVDEDGRSNLPNARSVNEALIALRVRINALSGDLETARALFEVFRDGIEPNLIYSARGTTRATERAVAEIEPVTVSYKEGQTLVEPGATITELEIERMNAYREEVRARGGDSLVFNKLFLERV